MVKLDKKQILIVIIIIIIMLFTIIVYFCKNIFIKKDSFYEDNLNEDTISINNSIENVDDEEEQNNQIMIHITGAVKKQGIVILEEGARIIDAIEMAGGETEDADLNKLNLAYVLEDGEKLYIPTKNDKEGEYISSDSGENVVIENSGNTSSTKAEIININTANKEKLETLNGIGESTANKIIKYREENGKFKTIEDIKNVPGIGDAKFENIKEYITVK